MRKTISFKEYMRNLLIRYTVGLIVLMFISFIVLMLLNFRLFIVKANEDCNQLVKEFIAQQYATYQMGIVSFSHNQAVKDGLAGSGNLREVNRLLYEFCLAQPIKANFVLMNQDGAIISTNLYKTNQMLFLSNGMVKDALVRLAAEPGETYRGAIQIPYDNGQQSALMFARAIQVDEGRVLGYLVFDLREDGLSTFMRNRNADIIVITDRFNNVIFSTNSLIVDSMGKYQSEQAEETSATIDKKPYYVTTENLPDSGLRVITMTSIAKQQQFVEFGGLFLFGISCFLILLVNILADKVTAKNVRSIDELLYAVGECLKGNIYYRINSHTFNEFQTLYDEFNQMMVKLQQLIKNNNELAERKRWMEVKHLEGQFNPHFVFNSMEALRYEILIDPAQAANMVVAFANLMRYSINYGSTHVPLKTDIGYVQDYLLLQKMRYGQRLTYCIDMDDSLLSCRVPKLFIQPIVENSVVHGLENSKKLTIQITGRALDNHLLLCVEDDGPGINKEQLDSLRALLADENAMPKHIGLYNVHRAAQLLYGKNCGLTVDSVSGKGMRVLLRMPIVMEENHV